MEEVHVIWDIIYSDVPGPYSTSRNDLKYFIACTDAKSRFTWVVNTPTKAASIFIRTFVDEFKNLNLNIRWIHSEN